MNTDKLMELERKWRGMNCRTEAQDRVYRVCADELAAALRAEQAVGTARQSEGVVPEGVYAPRYVADGPEGMFGTDDLRFAEAVIRKSLNPDDWTVTDLTETGIEATKEAAAPGGEGEVGRG